jgi:hypothetical protein
MKTRLQALGLLDRAIAAASDDELAAALEGLDADHLEALQRLTETDDPTPADLREAAARGRLDGGMEGVAIIIGDTCLADCIEQLGDHANNPSSEQLLEVLPGLVERHGVALVRIMLAATVAGEAPASPVIRDLLKNDDVIKLPPAEIKPVAPTRATTDTADRAELQERRREQRRQRQAEARTRREQSRRDRGRA